MILVTGAAGKTGSAVVKSLIDRDMSVRAQVYRDDYVARLRDVGVTDIVIGDLMDASVADRACDSVEAIYFIAPNMFRDEPGMAGNIIRAARAAGIERFVYHSVLHPQTRAMPHHWSKLEVEEALFESGLNYTILQPASYMQNIENAWPFITKVGVYAPPYSVDAPFTPVDLRDVAEVAAIVLIDSGHENAIYELCGPETHTTKTMAATLSQALGKNIRAGHTSLDEWSYLAQAQGLSTPTIDLLRQMFAYYDSNGFCGNSRVLEHLLEREPRSFKDYVAAFLSGEASD